MGGGTKMLYHAKLQHRISYFKGLNGEVMSFSEPVLEEEKAE